MFPIVIRKIVDDGWFLKSRQIENPVQGIQADEAYFTRPRAHIFTAKTMAFDFEKNKFAGPVTFQLPVFQKKVGRFNALKCALSNA